MGLPRAARPGGPRAPAGAVPHAGRGSRALSAAVAPGEPPAGSTVRLCVRHEVPGPRARPAVIGGPSQGRESATLPRPEAARRRARARAQRLHAVCCTPGRTLGLSAMTGGWGWRRGARGRGWVPTGSSCPLLPLSSLLTTCKCAGCWRAAPPTLLQHLPGGVPRGPPGPERFLWGQRGNPCLGAMPMAATRGHQAHSGLQGGPWRPRSEGGSRQPPTAMRALVGVFEVNPAPVLWPAEPWAWAAGAPWGSSRPARAAGAGAPGLTVVTLRVHGGQHSAKRTVASGVAPSWR